MKKKKTVKNQDTAQKKENTKADKKEIRAKVIQVFLMIAVFALTLLLCALCTRLYRIETAERIRTGVTVILLWLLLVFAEIRSRIAGDYLYDNGKHRMRFYGMFLALFAISCFFPMFTKTGWPLLFFAVVLTLLSNSITGMVSYTLILSFTCLTAQADFQTFFFYFFSGMCAVLLFSVLDENFRIEIPLILSLLCFAASFCANLLITQNANLTFQMLLVPLISLFLNTVLILMFLSYVNIAVANREKNKYQEINDPEFELMAKMKEAGKEYYYHAIHTAYLCNRISSKLYMDTDAIRAAGFYHGAGIIYGDDTLENLMKVCEEYDFPQKAREILQEYKKGGKILKKETAVVIMASEVIGTIMHLLAQNPEAKIPYGDEIGQLFRRKMDKGMFDACDISIYEMNQMKKILTEENLYYDFLR